MHCVPGVRAISEPYGPVHLHGLYVRKQIKIDQYRLLLKSYIRLLCKVERSNVSINMVISDTCNTCLVPIYVVGFTEYIREGDINKWCWNSFAEGALS